MDSSLKISLEDRNTFSKEKKKKKKNRFSNNIVLLQNYPISIKLKNKVITVVTTRFTKKYAPWMEPTAQYSRNQKKRMHQ